MCLLFVVKNFVVKNVQIVKNFVVKNIRRPNLRLGVKSCYFKFYSNNLEIRKGKCFLTKFKFEKIEICAFSRIGHFLHY